MNKSPPAIYDVCLQALRDINSSGRWPGTTIGRRLVILDSNKSFKELVAEKDAIKIKKEKNTSKREEVQREEGGGTR